MSNKPVLLIGLGGTGSIIASKIYHAIPDKEKGKVIVHIFDTDVNSVDKLNLKSTDRTIISSDLTVEKCLLKDYIKRSNAEAWFPTEHQSLLKTKFSDGAGQVRAISRLAYLDAIGCGKLRELEKKLGEFSEVNGMDYDDVRVMIVCSIAGGTGSGIFLQTGLFLKDYFNSRGKGVTVRGAFLLPDIFAKNGISTGSRVKNMYANGYACLKELDAIIKSTMGNGQEENVNIQLAYKPEMADEKVTFNPYDFVFLYDYENVDGKHLGSFEHYIDQISKALYLQLFSDIAGASDSDEINMLVNIVENDGRARYASSGVATLVYPYNDIVDYSTHRLASENMGKNWLKLDQLFNHELEEIENYKKQGIHREPLKKYIRMNELFDNEVKNGTPFFKNINRSLHLINKDNELGEKKTEEFLQNVVKRVKDDFDSAKEFDNFRQYKRPNHDNLFAKADDMRNEVEAFESHVNRFKKKVLDSIEDKKNLISSDITPIHIIENGDLSKFDYQLAYWILGQKDGEAMHPIASRYFLYELKLLLEDKIKTLNERTEDLYKLMEQYAKDFGQDSSASEVAAEKASNSGGLFGLFKKEYKVFAQEYEEKADKQFKRIEEYGYKKMLLGVYEDLLKSVDDLIENGEEMFFRILNEIMVDFSLKSDNLAKMHEDKTDVSKSYVLADRDSKDKLYDELIKNIDVENILKASYKDIFLEKYNEFILRRKRENRRVKNNLKENYKNKILEGYEHKIKDAQLLDFDVITALRKEIELSGKPYEEEANIMAERILNVKNRAKPFMLNSGDHQLKLWGINPQVLSGLSEEERDKYFGASNENLVSEGFSKYEIIRYSSIFGLKAQEFNKFSSTNSQSGNMPGDYFAAYKERVDKLNKNELTVTPHLDKRWHCINYMPDINDDQAQKDKVSIIDGFINGLLFENITARNKEGSEIWVFKDIHGNAQEIKNGDRELKAEYPILLNGLGNNPFIVDEIKHIFADKKEKEFGIFNRNLEKHSYIGLARPNAVNLVDILIKYVSQSGRANESEAKDKIIEILNAFMANSLNYINEYYSVTRKKTAVEVFAKFMFIILNNSAEYKASDKGLDFVDNIVEKIKVKSEMELNGIGEVLDKNAYEALTFEDLVQFIEERN